jgi:hypothetical protein
MPRLSSLQRAELVTETFEIAGEQVTATFDKSEVTLHWAKFAQDPETMADALASVVVEWDIQEDDGTAFPPDADNIATVADAGDRGVGEGDEPGVSAERG